MLTLEVHNLEKAEVLFTAPSHAVFEKNIAVQTTIRYKRLRNKVKPLCSKI